MSLFKPSIHEVALAINRLNPGELADISLVCLTFGLEQLSHENFVSAAVYSDISALLKYEAKSAAATYKILSEEILYRD